MAATGRHSRAAQDFAATGLSLNCGERVAVEHGRRDGAREAGFEVIEFGRGAGCVHGRECGTGLALG